MSTQKSVNLPLDGIAVAISGTCIIHCLFLPVIISLLPALEPWIAAEWVHQLMVLLALPVTGMALMNYMQRRFLVSFIMVSGLMLLLAGAFVHALHYYETPLTVMGAFILASGHIMRWHTLKEA